MKRRPKVGVLGMAALVVALIALSASTASGTTVGPPACTNTATLTGSAFEIDADANLVVNTTNCSDWLSVADIKKNDKPTGSGDDSFGQGTSENDPNPTIVDGSIPPNKSDLKTFGIFSEAGEVSADNPTGKFVELFWARVQNPNGTTNMDFELNQNVCDLTATPTNCADNGKNFPAETPVRKAGDRLVTYDLSKGGTVPTISVRTWLASGVWGPSTVISGGTSPLALGSVNTSTIASGNSEGLGSLSPYTFGEASVAFSALFGTNTCGKFGSVYLKSRSSDSFTAEIKDFIGPQRVSISNCATLTTSATSTVTVGGNISDTATLGGVSDDATGTITFHLFPSLADCTANTNEVNTGLTPIDVDGPGDYNSGNYATTTVGTFFWTAQYSGDGSNSSKSTACGDTGESSTVTKANSTISTSQVLVPNDSAQVNPSTATGTITFYLFKPGDTCSVANVANAVITQAKTPLVSGAASTTNSSDTDTLAGSHAAALGTWHWLVRYGGNGTLNGSDSVCTEAFTISES
jgi:hypothetical protein